MLDCVFRGNASIPYGLLALNPSGLKVERSEFFNFTDVGLRLSDNVTVSFGSSTPVIEAVRDILVDTVTRATPGSSNGTAEAGLMVGHPVANAVERVKVRNVSWSGLLVVNNAWRTTYRNLDIDMTGPREYVSVGVYLEHYSYENTFERFSVAARVGFNAEWADPAWGGRPAARNTIIRDGVVDAGAVSGSKNQAGVYLDEGTESTTVTNVVFRAQNWAGSRRLQEHRHERLRRRTRSRWTPGRRRSRTRTSTAARSASGAGASHRRARPCGGTTPMTRAPRPRSSARTSVGRGNELAQPGTARTSGGQRPGRRRRP